MVNGQFTLNRSAPKDTAIFFNVGQSTVNKIWRRAVANRLDPDINAYVAPSAIKGNSGRPQLYDRAELQLQLSELPLSDRRTMRSLAGKLGISVWSVWRLCTVENIIMPHSNAIKPWLTDENKETRFLYAADEVEKVSSAAGIEYRFKGVYDTVHLDEKWFFMTEATLRVYLAQEETAPVRAIRHKGHIVKVMFLAALARPRFDSDGCTFDGKIGCWPFVVQRPALRASANRPRGTLETKCVNVTAKAYTRMVRNKVIPAIIAKFPQEQGLHGRRTVVRLQHDNATSHFQWFDPKWIDMWFEHRLDWDFQLKEQPPNSPDCNILDLDFSEPCSPCSGNRRWQNRSTS
jgi:hypothetical protein